MSPREFRPSPDAERVPAWRIVAGGLLHFAMAAYLLLVVPLCFLLAPAHPSAEALAALALYLTLRFLLAIVACAVIALPAASLVDRAARRRRARASAAQDAPTRSQALVRRATGVPLDAALAPLLGRIAGARWDHSDPAFQSLARSLDEMVAATASALASAAPDRRPSVVVAAADALGRVADEVDRLATAGAQADEERMRAVLAFLETRYPALDSPLRPD